ncbi:MAG: phage minor capsid protein [Actinomycetota bacterium]|nr:phage minor capsid protein [Actinomycetota bacterium]
MYADAETDLITVMAAIARTGGPDMLPRMRTAAREVAATLQLEAGPLVDRLTAQAAQAGSSAASAELRAVTSASARLEAMFASPGLGSVDHGMLSAQMIANDLRSSLDAVGLRITRFADDAYRAAVASAATEQVLGATPAEAQAQAWRELTAKGVTGFVDRAGKHWNLSAYVEMATRTAALRAYNASHEARLLSMGVTYFTVSDTGRPCPLCLPWQGRVLSAGGASEITTWAADRDEHVTFRVDATVAEATAAGLFHPMCKHTLTAYLPGVTRLSAVSSWTDADEQRYRDTQRLRALERQVRAAKHQALGALTDLERKRAERLVRAGQARIRNHVAQTGLLRRPRREQLDLGNK